MQSKEERFAWALDNHCPACDASPYEKCVKLNGSARKTPHGPRRNRPDRDWPNRRGVAQ